MYVTCLSPLQAVDTLVEDCVYVTCLSPLQAVDTLVEDPKRVLHIEADQTISTDELVA